MSNKVINAVIALVEDRPKDAREMLRSPELKISASEVSSRLSVALAKREYAAQVKILKQLLSASLRIEAPVELGDASRAYYLTGVATVESIAEELIGQLTS